MAPSEARAEAPVPTWVKAIIGLAFAAILVVVAIRSLDPETGVGVELPGGGGVKVDAQQPEAGTGAPVDEVREPTVDTRPSHMLNVRGVELFPRSDTAEVQVTAFVNGTEFQYPSLAGIEWLRVAPTMAGQTFKLPSAETYEIRFEMRKREGPDGEIAHLRSVETMTLREAADHRIYQLRGFDPASMTRSGQVTAEVIFALEAAP